ERKRGWGRWVALLLVVGLALAAGGVAYVLLADDGGSSSSTSSPPTTSAAKPSGAPTTPAATESAPTSSAPSVKPSSAHALALQGLRGRALLVPECQPLKGTRWVYPVGPPVRGLPDIEADIQSDLYEVFAINFSCKEAAAW